MLRDSWTMECDCKSPHCREIVGDFSKLDAKIQLKYRNLNILPVYIIEYMDSKLGTASKK
jgi:hypothetical protein